MATRGNDSLRDELAVRQPETQNLYSQPAQVQAPVQTQKQPVSYINAQGQKATGVADMPKNTDSYYDDMRGYYQNMYDEAVRNNNDAADQAAEQARRAAEAERQALLQGYQGTNRQLYRDYMQNRKTLPQKMAAAGYSGGLSESARIRLANSYEEALAENERARLGQQATSDANLANRLYEIQAAADQGNQQARQQQLAYEQALREQQRQDLITRADTLAASGDFSGYRSLGYSQNEIDALARTWLAAHPEMTSSWIAAHPDDASRLNITAPSTGGGGYYEGNGNGTGGGGGSGNGGSASLNQMVQQAVLDGASWKDITQTLNDMVRAGEITPAERNGAMTYVYANSNDSEDIPALYSQPNKTNRGSNNGGGWNIRQGQDLH